MYVMHLDYGSYLYCKSIKAVTAKKYAKNV